MRAWARLVMIGVAWIAGAGCPSAGARELLDATGARVRLGAAPARIVTLTPSLGELAATLLRGEKPARIVGVSAYSDEPPLLARLPRVASAGRINLEAVISVRPDLVLASREDNPAEQLSHLRELGVPVVVTSARTLAGIEETFRLAGRALGEEKEGNRLADRLRDGIERFARRERARLKRGESRPRVLLELDDNPLIVVGGGNFVDEELRAVGAVNLYGDKRRPYPRISLEDAIRGKPDQILILGKGSDMGYFRKIAGGWSRFPRLPAVRDHKVQVLNGDAIVRPGVRILQGMALLERSIYGKDSGR